MTINAFWNQGEVQAGRVFSRPQSVEADHEQRVFWPPAVLEARIRIGWIPREDHLRWQIEVIDPACQELLAMNSAYHRLISKHGYVPLEIVHRLARFLPPILDPDVFAEHNLSRISDEDDGAASPPPSAPRKQ